MTKYPYILFVLLLASFSSCQTVEQLSIDYMLPAEISFPNELKRVAVVNNVSDTPDNTLPPKDNTIKNKNELSRAVAYHEGQPALTTEALAKAIAEQNYFNEVVICDSACVHVISHPVNRLSAKRKFRPWHSFWTWIASSHWKTCR